MISPDGVKVNMGCEVAYIINGYITLERLKLQDGVLKKIKP